MVNYRRNYVPGGTYFFTVTLRDRSSRILTAHVELLREAFRAVRCKQPFRIDAIAVLPEHLHTIWTLPEGDDDYPGRWRAIKSAFTRNVVKSGVAVARNDKGEYALWQRRYWEHTIADESDFRHHVDYIHFNPVKHGWAQQPMDWPYSSFHRYVQLGILPPDWADSGEEGNFGERQQPIVIGKCPGIGVSGAAYRVRRIGYGVARMQRSAIRERPPGRMVGGTVAIIPP